MPCPFGFTAEDGPMPGEEEDLGDYEELSPRPSDGEEEEEHEKEEGTKTKKKRAPRKAAEDGVDGDKKAEADGEKKTKKDKKKAKETSEGGFDYEKDPVRWFYQNQIKSEEDFQKKKDTLREMARKRLDDIMAKKGKSVTWPDSDSDLDSLSIRSSELSELDSDVDSLSSLISCADSWIEDSKYPTPAENTMLWTVPAAGCVVVYLLYIAFLAMASTRKVQGVVLNPYWPNATFLVAGVAGAVLMLAFMAVRYRSKRMLLGSQCGLVIIYAVAVALTFCTVFQPTVVDVKLKDAACVKYSKSDSGSKLCKMLPSIETDLRAHMESLVWADALMALLCIANVSVGMWYMFELAYIEKRAIKFKRRHKRRKHSIPWEKIKIVGPVTNCGANKAPGAAGGKCPVTGGGGGASTSGGKCPIGFGGGGGAAAESKKSK